METEHTETVVDKAVAFVKDMFGVHPDPTPEVQAKREYSDTAPEVTAEDAMRLNPNAYEGLVPPESGTVFDDNVERERRDAAGLPRPVNR
jgi:hypothetical protein